MQFGTTGGTRFYGVGGMLRGYREGGFIVGELFDK